MAMKRCPDCGEKYSDTYKRCPFCEEEELTGDSPRGGRQTASQNQSFSLVTPTLIFLIVVMSALLLYLLFGENLSNRQQNTDPISSATSEVQTPAASSADEPDVSTADTPAPDASGVMPEDPEITEPEVSYDAVDALPDGLTLNKTDFTMSVGDPDVALSVSGGSADYTWVSENPAIATVDSKGKITAVSGGTIHVLVSDGSRKGVCIVRVKGGTSSNNSTAHTPSTGAKLNKTDFTMSVGDLSVQLTVQGVTTAVTWSSSDPAIATVDSKGLVKAVGAGHCTVTAAFDGQSLECIVRVKG